MLAVIKEVFCRVTERATLQETGIARRGGTDRKRVAARGPAVLVPASWNSCDGSNGLLLLRSVSKSLLEFLKCHICGLCRCEGGRRLGSCRDYIGWRKLVGLGPRGHVVVAHGVSRSARGVGAGITLVALTARCWIRMVSCTVTLADDAPKVGWPV